MPPSLRTRQKWMAISKAAASGNGDAVQDVEAQQASLADEPASQEQKARIAARVDQIARRPP